MPSRERFLYHGTATAISGRLRGPTPAWLDIGGASVLPVDGGASRAAVGATDFGGVLGFRRATTHAQGEPHGAATVPRARRGARLQADPISLAHAGAEIRDLRVGTRVRFTAVHVRAELTAQCACSASQPSIGAMDGAFFDGISIGRHRLSVTVNRRFFATHDTHEKLCAMCAAPDARSLPRAVLHAPHSVQHGATYAHDHYDPDDRGPLLTTIVRSLRWLDRPYPRATIDGHALTVPGFGRILFGEMIITGPTRRLTMLRFELSGDVALDAACCEVEAGGSWRR